MKTSAAVTMDSGLTGAKRETRIQIKAWSRSLWFGPHCWHLIYTFISRLKDKISPSQLTSLSSLLAWVLSGRESAIGQMGDSINYQCVTTNGSHLATLLLQRSALPISACFFFFKYPPAFSTSTCILFILPPLLLCQKIYCLQLCIHALWCSSGN